MNYTKNMKKRYKCKKCKEWWDEEGFVYRGGGIGTEFDLIAPCRRCRRAKIYRDRYGIALVDVEDTLQKQGFACGICKIRLDGLESGCIDMDRSGPRLRGIVCAPCSLGIRQFRHDAAWLRTAAGYLEFHDSSASSRHSSAAG